MSIQMNNEASLLWGDICCLHDDEVVVDEEVVGDEVVVDEEEVVDEEVDVDEEVVGEEVVDVDEEVVDEEFENESDFSSISKELEFKTVVSRKRKNKNVQIKEDIIEESQTKTIVCKSVHEQRECDYGSKCKFAHFIDEISVNECSFGDFCKKVKYSNKKDYYFNTNSSHPCAFIHPFEKFKNFYVRNCLKERPEQKEPSFKCTKLCQYILDNVKCEKKICDYAHRIDELNISPCHFGEQCFNINKCGSEYGNNSSEKICIFLHPDETLKNYERRIMPTKKRKHQNINDCEPEQKKPKLIHKEIILEEEKITITAPAHKATEILKILIDNGISNINLVTY